jgi:uncharacterized protein YndB with AHSA1/START domain
MTTSVAPVEFSISRTFNAPRERVWRAFTEADSLAQWWGPKGSAIRVLRLDLRPGGIFHYSMEFQPGHPMYGRFIYREIVAPERLVYVSAFSDAGGGVTRAPFPQIKDSWPLEVLNVMTLTEDAGRTTLSLRGHPIDASAEEMKTYAGMFDSMRQGFGGTFDQLDAWLAKAKVT